MHVHCGPMRITSLGLNGWFGKSPNLSVRDLVGPGFLSDGRRGLLGASGSNSYERLVIVGAGVGQTPDFGVCVFVGHSLRGLLGFTFGSQASIRFFCIGLSSCGFIARVSCLIFLATGEVASFKVFRNFNELLCRISRETAGTCIIIVGPTRGSRAYGSLAGVARVLISVRTSWSALLFPW